MEEIMDVIFITHKRKYLDVAEKYHIYQKNKKKQINWQNIINKNKICDVIVKHDPLQTAYRQPQAVAVYVKVSF